MNSTQLVLKSETHSLHRKLESHPLQRLLLSPELTEHALQRILQAYLGFYLPLEVKLARFIPDVHPTYSFQSPHLLRDLIALQTDLQNLMLCEQLPEVESSSDALGILYVLEGARLGGAVISRHMKGLLPSLRMHFFVNSGQSLARDWTGFVRLLDSTLVTTSQRSSAVTTASATFTCFALWLDSFDPV
jgi:heme oxygenase